MSLTPGTRLGPYEIVGLLGKGGMGEVYRAHDPRVGRDVAIKTSRAEFSERFEREARAVAALNHPNICHLYDVGKNYLVMELVEGENLRGPMPVDEAMGVARQIAAALEAAHEKGIVHRDLKPANVKITPDGVVKVLDFGLARFAAPEPEVTNDSPTIQNVPQGSPTIIGTILGTAAYMSPEQARGKVADKRADIWAFGVVLYELLTGKRLFEGETVSDVLAGVLKQEPDLSAVPVNLRRLIAKCLQKDPKKRLRDIGDWEELIEDEHAPVAERKRPVAWMALCGVAVLALAGLGAIHFRETRGGAGQAMHLSVALPESINQVGFMALSPDGRTLVFGGFGADGKPPILSLRALGSDQFRTLPGTELARAPFWSGDGKNIAFTVNGKLKFVAANGGPAQELCDGVGEGGTWNRDNVILIGGGGARGQILRTSGSGGGCSPLPGDPAAARWYPWFLPDGKHFLYTSALLVPDSAAASKTGVYLASLEDPASGTRLLPDDTSAIFAPGDSGGDGYLLFRREGALVGQAFDPGTLQLSGEVFQISDDVGLNLSARMMAAAGPNGVLVYGTGRSTNTQLTWLDRAGKALSPSGPVLNQRDVALSPDGRQIAVSRGVSVEDSDIWLRDAASNSESRFTSPPLGGRAAVWSPDGKTLVFTGSDQNLYRKAASGDGKEELLLKTGNPKSASDWSRDGRFLLYTETDVRTKADIWVLPNPAGKAGDSKPYAFQQTEAVESQAQLSPDGRWVAYTSDESGDLEVYVRPFPSGEGRWKVSVKRAQEPRWRSDGKELFYLELASPRMHFMAAAVTGGASGSFVASMPVQLFEHATNPWVIQLNLFDYAVAADGQRFFVLSKPEVKESIHVLTNWMQEIGKK